MCVDQLPQRPVTGVVPPGDQQCPVGAQHAGDPAQHRRRVVAHVQHLVEDDDVVAAGIGLPRRIEQVADGEIGALIGEPVGQHVGLIDGRG